MGEITFENMPFQFSVFIEGNLAAANIVTALSDLDIMSTFFLASFTRYEEVIQFNIYTYIYV